MPPFYSCPKCEKEISCAIDTEYSAIFSGWGAFLKDKCQFCGAKVSVNWAHYLTTVLIILGIIALCYLIGSFILSGASEKKQTVISLIMFGTFFPLGMVLFYVVLPWLFGLIGLRFYN